MNKGRKPDFTGADLDYLNTKVKLIKEQRSAPESWVHEYAPIKAPKPSNAPIILDHNEQPISVPEAVQKTPNQELDDYLKTLLGDWVEQTNKNIK